MLVCDLDECTQVGVTPEGGHCEITPVIKGHFISRPRAPPTAADYTLAVERVPANISPDIGGL